VDSTFDIMDQVVHARFGNGKVLETRDGSAQVKVAFGGFSLWIASSSLTLVAKGILPARPVEAAVPVRFSAPASSAVAEVQAASTVPSASAPASSAVAEVQAASTVPSASAPASSAVAEVQAASTVPSASAPAQSDSHREYRRLVEGLRMGVVPDCGLREWTVGRPKVLADVEAWLSARDRGTLLVEGAYGSGKTHLIRHTAAVALDKGFAVSQVRVDPTEENSSFPLRFYGAVMRELLIPGRKGVRLTFRDVLREAVRTRRETCLDSHPFHSRSQRGSADLSGCAPGGGAHPPGNVP